MKHIRATKSSCFVAARFEVGRNVNRVKAIWEDTKNLLLRGYR